MSSNLRAEYKWHRIRKCSVVSTSVPQGLIVSSKPYLNLCSFRWLNLNLKHVRRFAPSGSWTENKELSFFSLITEFLKILSDLALLISTLRLFYSFMQHGKNVFLKDFVFDGIAFIIEADADLRL